ncbi:DMT family transporter [Rhodococcus rhodnii]|uniref:Integral membrane protein n=1 Tax=Rhodococcus rhodnii LMG 5362 TaxID=1273125 RepID=R7WIJ2_9NOCA|nr:DMT family transporter [Rhodococcus rhodnii]EOM75042.1 hypothetical protein Rrhod_3655 [Rhodococcus rhodnii LMG 5362]
MLSVACAVVAALLFAIASVAQQREAASAAAASGEANLLRTLIRSPRWWAGLAGDGGGYLFQAAALAFGSVLVVQPLLTASLLFALPLSAWFARTPVGRTAWLLAGTLAVALAVFLVVGDPTEQQRDPGFPQWAPALAVVGVVVVAACAAGLAPLAPRVRALGFGVACGTLYGVAAALTKHVVDQFEHGVFSALTGWQTWLLVGCGAAGVYLQQRAFAAGPLTASLPALTIAEPLAAVFLGVTVLGEHLHTGTAGTVVVAIAIVVMIVATVALSRARAEVSVGTPPAAPVS